MFLEKGAGFELALKGQLGSRGGGGGRRSRKRQRRQPLHRPLPQGTLQHQAKLILRDRRRGGRAVLFRRTETKVTVPTGHPRGGAGDQVCTGRRNRGCARWGDKMCDM